MTALLCTEDVTEGARKRNRPETVRWGDSIDVGEKPSKRSHDQN